MFFFSSNFPSRLPSFGALLFRSHRQAFIRLSILPIACFLYWLIFVMSGHTVWKISAIALTEKFDPWFSWIVPFWDSVQRRHVPRWPYPTVEHARHLVAIAWLLIYATILLSTVFMPALVRTAVVAGREDPAMAYKIRMISFLAWLVLAVTLWLSPFQGHNTHQILKDVLALPVMAILCAYCTILWICALLAHRQLGDRWRDFKGPS